MITDATIKKYLLHEGPNSVEWYKALLTLHNFKMTETYNNGYDWRINKVKINNTESSRLDNYMKAKDELKKEKKNEKDISI